MSDSIAATVQDLFDLTGRVALVTGASGWLGAAMAEGLAEAGCRVVVASRDEDRARRTAELLPKVNGAGHLGVALDHMEPESLRKGFAAAEAAVPQIDILVNNGLELIAHDWTDVDYAEFARHQANNAGYFELARLLYRHAVAKSAPASIVMVGSMYGMVGSYPDTYEGVCAASPVAYHTLKGGTIHMTRHLAVYWARHRVRVNCLSPGPFPNDKVRAELVERLNQKSPMGRMGRPSELKGALLLLASDAGSYITGQNLVVDGGWTAW